MSVRDVGDAVPYITNEEAPFEEGEIQYGSDGMPYGSDNLTFDGGETTYCGGDMPYGSGLPHADDKTRPANGRMRRANILPQYADDEAQPAYGDARTGSRAARAAGPAHTPGMAGADGPAQATNPARADSPVRAAVTVIIVFAAAFGLLALLSYGGIDVPYFTPAFDKLTGRAAASGSAGAKGASGAGAYVRASGGTGGGAADAGSGDNGGCAASDNAGLGGPGGDTGRFGGLVGSGGAWDGAAIRMPAFSLSYDISEETEFCVYKGYLAECSRDSFSLFDKSGYEVFRRSVDFIKPAMYRGGDYLLVCDSGGRSAFAMKGAKVVWEETFAGGVISASINRSGYIAMVLEAAGYRNGVRAFAPVGRALFDRIVADDYILDSKAAPSGGGLVINRLKTDGVSLCSSLEFVDMKSEPVRAIDSGDDAVFLNICYLEDDTLAAVTENRLLLYSDAGEPLVNEKFESVMALCEFPPKKAAVAVQRKNRVLVTEYGAKAAKGRAIAISDTPVRNMSADNGCLFVNYGGEVLVIKENGKTLARLTLDAEALYGDASEKFGVLVVTKTSADAYGF